jgi:hypothetical protein
LFALVAALSQCLCSESPYLSIKLHRMYVFFIFILSMLSMYVCMYVCMFMNITIYIAFAIIRGFT